MKKAFSLAEVLVTLTILGVIFAVTMPALNFSIRDKENYAKARKSYTMLSDAMTLASLSSSDNSEFSVVDGSDANMKQWFDRFLKPHLRVHKVCYNTAGCWNDGDTKYLNGSIVPWNRTGVGIGNGIITAILEDGTLINIDGYSKSDVLAHYGVEIPGNAGLVLFFDVNGKKAPNTAGKDIFATVFYDDTLVPAFSSKDDDAINASCTASGTGYSCLQKIIHDGLESRK